MRRLDIVLALVFCSHLAGTTAVAADLDDGLAAWSDGEHEHALAIWESLANRAHPQANLFLGYVFRNGVQVPRDDVRAAHWYRRAAELGQPEAQYELALMYELGLGVPVDPDEAANWYGLAAEQACPAELSAGGRLGDR